MKWKQVYLHVSPSDGNVTGSWCDDNDKLRYVTWNLDDCPDDVDSVEAKNAEIVR